MAYAESTTVPFEKSISEIMRLISKAGADQVGQMQSHDGFAIEFTLSDRMVRFRVPFDQMGDMPERDGRGSKLSPAKRQAKLDQSRRQRGRALMLTIKAKLESIESGIETFEQAFLANIVMSNGETVHERIAIGIAKEYSEGRPDMALLPPPEAR